MQWVGRKVQMKCEGVFRERGTSYDVCVGVGNGRVNVVDYSEIFMSSFTSVKYKWAF